jgi:hypothetical protein
MPMLIWKNDKRANAQKLIDWLLARRQRLGIWSTEWVTTVAFAELGYSSSQPNLTTSLITKVLNEMSRNNKKTVEDFETTLAQIRKADATTANKKVDNWQFFIPIKVKLNPNISQRPQIRILGRNFSFIRLSSVKRQFDSQNKTTLEDPNIIRRNTGIEINSIPEVFLSVSSHALDHYLAWEQVAPAFDVLRGAIEMTLGIYRGRIDGRGARRQISHPLWMVAYKKGYQPEWMVFLTEEDRTTRLFDINNEHLTLIKKNAEILKREPNPKSTISLIADCLRLYSQAMDANFNHLCLLGFWQLAEAITCSEGFGGKTDKVASRIAWHGVEYGLKGTGYLETLVALGNKRNNIVHRGIHDVEDNDVNILKAACEIALEWLFKVHNSLPTIAHIEHYYSLREKSDSDLKVIRDSLVYVKSIKTTK